MMFGQSRVSPISDYDTEPSRLREAGFAVEDAEELWGERRASAVMPGGQRVEVMAAAPPSSGQATSPGR
jgi:hypothetical protein